MRLSCKAKKLLDNNEILELQQMPIEQLLDPIDYQKYLSLYDSKVSDLSSFGSIPENLRDAAAILKLINPVVISNGYVYPQKVIDVITRGDSPTFYCPDSGKKIVKSTLGNSERKSSFITLPQIDSAVICLKEINKLNRSPCRFNVVLKVSDCKLRILIKPIRRDNLVGLKNIFTNLMPDPESGAVLNHRNRLGGYLVENFGFCWLINPGKEARMEFWFPSSNRLSDAQVNETISAFLAPLNLPAANTVNDSSFWGSMDSVKPRNYFDAFAPMQMTALETARCCKNFFDHLNKLAREELNTSLNNVVVLGSRPEIQARYSGVMFFSPLRAYVPDNLLPGVPTNASEAATTLAL